jgi:hypothetical protein
VHPVPDLQQHHHAITGQQCPVSTSPRWTSNKLLCVQCIECKLD